ncbi:PDC sensor domain-containing protein [Methanolacinia petrolearia]|uniref:PDC sensor domain-containing protein n=1 Tax=Methanolacinia petrolearia TaxID=54120 RepID=UPI003BA976F8
MPISLQEQNLNAISEKSIEKSMHVDFALSNYINEAKYDVLGLSLNKIVRTPDDSGFTNYLNISDESFHSSGGTVEEDIADIMRGFQVSHPNVQSVYMGRENGAFVWSYAWENATDYDPRSRPWYILATENPGGVVITDPYIPITTPYVKIAISKALVDTDSNVYGVVGTDLNLVNLTGYISGIETDYEGEMVLTDHNGTIIACKNQSALFTNIGSVEILILVI